MPLVTTKTDAELYRDRCASSLLMQAHTALDRLIESFDEFWSNPIVFSGYLGVDALEAFTKHAATGEYIATIAPELASRIPRIDTERWDMKWQPDGSLLVTAIELPPTEDVTEEAGPTEDV